jgi:hypothetical protein
MAQIDVELTPSCEGWVAQVSISEKGSSTTHRVTLKRQDFKRLSQGRCSPEECIRSSFEFLLEREAKESILTEFDLPIISRYFPEYEAELARRLSK